VANAAEFDETEHGCGDAGACAEARGGRRGVTVEQPKVARLAARQSCNTHMRRRRTHLVRLVDESSHTPGATRCALRPRREGSSALRKFCWDVCAGCKAVDGGRGSLSTVRGCESRERALKGERKETDAEGRAMDKGDHATSASSPEARRRRHRARSGQIVQAGDVFERGPGERWAARAWWERACDPGNSAQNAARCSPGFQPQDYVQATLPREKASKRRGLICVLYIETGIIPLPY
jgi:hypothetical protein